MIFNDQNNFLHMLVRHMDDFAMTYGKFMNALET